MHALRSYFSNNKKPTTPPPPTPDTPIFCCHSLAHAALTQTPTCWSHAPKYQNRLKDFLTWIDSITSAESGNDSWVEIASYTDLEKADFAFMIVPDGVKPEDKDEEMNKERVFIPLPGGKSFTQIGSAQDFLQFNHKDYVSTGNTVRLVCPECRAGFKITLLHKKGRSIDIQLCDIKDSPTRKAVEEMKSVFPGWRYDDLRAVIKKYNGGLREAMEEVKSKNAGLA